MLAAYEGTPLVLRDMAPGLSKQGPPWDIEGEPGGPKNFALKRLFEADNEGNATGHFGYHKKIPSCIQTPSVSPPPHISNHYSPRVRTHHHDVALKLPAIFILRPIERAHSWKRTRWQCSHLNQHVAQLHTSHAGHIPSCAHQIKQSSPSVHEICILPQSPDCV